MGFGYKKIDTIKYQLIINGAVVEDIYNFSLLNDLIYKISISKYIIIHFFVLRIHFEKKMKLLNFKFKYYYKSINFIFFNHLKNLFSYLVGYFLSNILITLINSLSKFSSKKDKAFLLRLLGTP